MFGKLLKYDFRSMLKQFAFVWPAALVLALINHFTLGGLDSTSAVGETTAGVMIFVYVAILMAMFILALVFTIQRFYKGLLGDEGYLMHTLPVKPWQLIGSKLLCAVTTTILSMVVAVLSIFLVVSEQPGTDIAELFRLFWYLIRAWGIDASIAAGASHAVLWIAEFFLFLIVGMAAGYLRLYLSMAIGHLFHKNRVAWSVAAFIGLDIVVSLVLNVLDHAGILDRFSGWAELAVRTTSQGFGWSGAHLFVWSLIAWQAVLAAVFFAGTNYILHKRLNLE